MGLQRMGRYRVESGNAQGLSGFDLILHAITFAFDQYGLGMMQKVYSDATRLGVQFGCTSSCGSRMICACRVR